MRNLGGLGASGFRVGMAGVVSGKLGEGQMDSGRGAVQCALTVLGHEIKEADVEDGTGDGHVCSDCKQTNDTKHKSDGA